MLFPYAHVYPHKHIDRRTNTHIYTKTQTQIQTSICIHTDRHKDTDRETPLSCMPRYLGRVDGEAAAAVLDAVGHDLLPVGHEDGDVVRAVRPVHQHLGEGWRVEHAIGDGGSTPGQPAR